jgi:hypothetical protein
VIGEWGHFSKSKRHTQRAPILKKLSLIDSAAGFAGSSVVTRFADGLGLFLDRFFTLRGGLVCGGTEKEQERL